VTDKCLVSLADATDAGLCGGKASGLAHLERGGMKRTPTPAQVSPELMRRLKEEGSR